MLKRWTVAFVGTIVAYALLGSVVYTGISLSRKLMGRWIVVQVFGQDVSHGKPPMMVEFDRNGALIGRSGCGTFTGRWSTGRSQLHFQALQPSQCDCGDLRNVEQGILRAMTISNAHRLEKKELVLLQEGRPVALLVQTRA